METIKKISWWNIIFAGFIGFFSSLKIIGIFPILFGIFLAIFIFFKYRENLYKCLIFAILSPVIFVFCMFFGTFLVFLFLLLAAYNGFVIYTIASIFSVLIMVFFVKFLFNKKISSTDFILTIIVGALTGLLIVIFYGDNAKMSHCLYIWHTLVAGFIAYIFEKNKHE